LVEILILKKKLIYNYKNDCNLITFTSFVQFAK
jgi:hypothetical protein